MGPDSLSLSLSLVIQLANTLTLSPDHFSLGGAAFNSSCVCTVRDEEGKRVGRFVFFLFCCWQTVVGAELVSAALVHVVVLLFSLILELPSVFPLSVKSPQPLRRSIQL